MAARFTAAAYAAALRALFPRGRVWRFGDGGVQAKVAAGLAAVYERSDAAATALLVDAFPATADALLPEWESTLGFPDPVAGPAPDDDTRRAHVAARFSDPGGQSAQSFLDFADGFALELTHVPVQGPFRVGQNSMGQPLGSAEWAHVWGLSVQDSGALSDWEKAILARELAAKAPSHTVLDLTFD